MQSRPIDESMQLSYRLPLAPLNMHFSDNPRENRLYNVALSMLNFSRSLEFPFDGRLWQTTEQFAEQVVASLPEPFSIREEFLDELYSYFYREITLSQDVYKRQVRGVVIRIPAQTAKEPPRLDIRRGGQLPVLQIRALRLVRGDRASPVKTFWKSVSHRIHIMSAAL